MIQSFDGLIYNLNNSYEINLYYAINNKGKIIMQSE